MRTIGFLVWIMISTSSVLLSAEGPNQQLTASDFRVTLQEQPNSDLPLGPGCTGEAAKTLQCQAFTVTLQNVSSHTVEINKGDYCVGDYIWIQQALAGPTRQADGAPIRDRKASSWPAFGGAAGCPIPGNPHERLRPGERTQRTFRLRGPKRRASGPAAGKQYLQARWELVGCIEQPEGMECVPTHVAHHVVFVESSVIEVAAPPIPDLGTPGFAVEITAHPGKLPDSLYGTIQWAGEKKPHPFHTGCPEVTNTIDCMVFHAKIKVRNIGPLAVRNCALEHVADFIPEYRVPGGTWILLRHVRLSRTAGTGATCYERAILAGKPLEGDFTILLLNLDYPFDTSPLRKGGKYQLRFLFEPNACIASPDGGFCLTHHFTEPKVVSNEITLTLATEKENKDSHWGKVTMPIDMALQWGQSDALR